MSIKTTILLSDINTESSISTYSYSDKQKGAGYHRGDNGVHTVNYSVNAFLGDIIIQGTLEQYPSDDDTDWINATTFAGDSSFYGNTDSTDYQASQTFTGKYVWIRAKYLLQNGTIRQVRYNL